MPDTVITAVGATCLAAGLGEFEPSSEQSATLALQERLPVHNMQIKKALLTDEQHLTEVGMLQQSTHTCKSLQSSSVVKYLRSYGRISNAHRNCAVH